MNKNLYLLGIFFLTLTLAAGIFHSILLLNQEFSLVLEQSYANWFLLFSITNLMASVFILRYFHFKQWTFVLVSGLVTIGLHGINAIFQYWMFIKAVRQPSLLYMILVVASLVGGIVMGAGYNFSDARKNTILKWLGAVMIVVGAGLLIVVFAANLGIPTLIAQRAILWLTSAVSI